MLNESRQNSSTKESLLFCILGGLFVYGVCSIPYLQLYLFPPENDGGIDFSMYCIQPPNKYAFIISFSIFTILGIYLSKKLNLKNRLAHFSFLALILSIGGGIITSLLAFIYFFAIADSSLRNIFFEALQENWFETIMINLEPFWSIVFLLAFIPFTSLFLLTTSLISKIKTHNSLK